MCPHSVSYLELSQFLFESVLGLEQREAWGSSSIHPDTAPDTPDMAPLALLVFPQELQVCACVGGQHL